jgi:hypothetical protein
MNVTTKPTDLINTSIYYHDKPWNLDQWIEKICNDFCTFQIKTLRGDLEALPAEDRQYLIDFATRIEKLHSAAYEPEIDPDNNLNFFKKIASLGANIQALDTNGDSLLGKTQNQALFEWLLEQGASFVNRHKHSLLPYVLDKIEDIWHPQEAMDWKLILLKVLPKVPLLDFMNLNEDQMIKITTLIKEAPEFANVMKLKALEAFQQEPEKTIELVVEFFNHANMTTELPHFIDLIEEKFIPDDVIEQIILNPKFIFLHFDNLFFDVLPSVWQPPIGDLERYFKQLGHFRMAVFVVGLLNVKSLHEASKVALEIEKIGGHIENLNEEIKKGIIGHIMALQEKEKKTLWHFLAKRNFTVSTLIELEKLGFDPNWNDNKNKQNLLFTRIAARIGCYYIKNSKINLHHKDGEGNNVDKGGAEAKPGFSLCRTDSGSLS